MREKPNMSRANIYPRCEVANILSVVNVFENFGRTCVLSGVSFDVRAGQTVLLLGPNGAGKTAVIKCTLWLLNFAGFLEVDGIDVKSKGSLAGAKIGYLSKLSSCYDTLTIEQHARLMAGLKGANKNEIKRSLEIAGLQHVRGRMVKALSNCMRQTLGLSIAMLSEPPLLILDEPTSYSDLKGQLDFERMLQKMKDIGKASLIPIHLSGLGLVADRVVVLDSGRVVAKGTSYEILQKIGLSDKMYLNVGESQLSIVKEVVNIFGRRPEFEDGRLLFPLSPAQRASFLECLLRRGVKVNDPLVQQFSIELEYVGLLRVKQQ